MANVIEQLYQVAEIHYVAGDALRFSVRASQRDPDDPGTEEAPNIIPMPLDGYTVAAQIRKNSKKDSVLIATFDVEIDSVETDLIWVYLPPDQSELLRGYTVAAWDLQLTDEDGDPRTIMGGPMRPTGDVTRD